MYLRDPESLVVNSSVAIKAECRRRILLIMTEDQQRNSLAEMVLKKTDQHRALWDEIESLRARSNEIEAMDPLPADLADDALWGSLD